MTWRLEIWGRRSGAIGLFYKIPGTFKVQADTVGQARDAAIALANERERGWEVHHVMTCHADLSGEE